MSAAAVIFRRRKRFIRRFRDQGANAPDRAIPYSQIGMRRTWVFDHMVARGVFVDQGDDRFYMDERAAESFLQAQRQRALIGGGILLLLFLIYVLITVMA